MFTSKELNPARNIIESRGAYRARRKAVASKIETHLQGLLIWSARAGTMRAGRNAAKRLKKLSRFA